MSDLRFRSSAPLVACIVFGVPAISAVAMFAGENTMFYVGGAVALFIGALVAAMVWRQRQVRAQMERILEEK